MISDLDLRTYVEQQPEELKLLQHLAEYSGMKVFVEVNEHFPNNFIDTLPSLSSICKRFNVSHENIKLITETFIKNEKGLLARISNFRPTVRPHEVTISFLLTVAIARKYADSLDIASLQDLGWHEDVAKIVLAAGG